MGRDFSICRRSTDGGMEVLQIIQDGGITCDDLQIEVFPGITDSEFQEGSYVMCLS